MARKKKNRGGRPVTIAADRVINYRVDDATVEALATLAAQWQCSKSEALRRAIKQALPSDHS